MAMKLNTGKVAFPIEFDNGDKDCIYFNPNDPDFAVRLCEFRARVDEELKNARKINLDENGNPSNNLQVEEFKKIKATILKEVDRAFNADISSVVFKHCSPFAIIGDQYFIEHFIETITPEVEACIKASKKKINEKMKKHLSKYDINI